MVAIPAKLETLVRLLCECLTSVIVSAGNYNSYHWCGNSHALLAENEAHSPKECRLQLSSSDPIMGDFLETMKAPRCQQKYFIFQVLWKDTPE